MVVEVSMKNKKGFTLIELIATIVLITLSSTIIVLNLQGSTSKEDNSLSTKNNKQITDAACNVIDSLNASNIFNTTRENCKNNGCSVKLVTLIQNGFVDGYATYDDTGSRINEQNRPQNYYVSIRWNKESDGFWKKTCTLYNGNQKIYP